jgi:uncharacterized protein with HEPN domain
MKQPKPYLLSIISAIDAVESYRPSSEEAFMVDPKSKDAILMRLQDIGENLLRLRDLFPDFWDDNVTDAWVKAIRPA